MSKRSNTSSITSFFDKRPRQSPVNPVNDNIQEEAPAPPTTETSSPEIYDIAHVVNVQLSRSQKHKVLMNSFMPPDDFQWPFEERISKGKTEKRFLRLEHLQKNSVLVFFGSITDYTARYACYMQIYKKNSTKSWSATDLFTQ